MSSEPAAPSDAGVSPALLAAAALRFPLADGESPIGRLYRDAIQRIFSCLAPAELAVTHRVSQLWRAAHDSERQARWLVTQILPRTIKRLQAELASADESTQVHAVTEIRMLLSRNDPPIGEVIATPGMLPRLVEILQSPVPRLQFEAGWALTNIASGTSRHCQALLDAGIVPILVRMLSNKDASFADATEQAVWCIGNIAADSAKFRNLVLQSGALAPMLALVKPDAPLTLMRNTAWSISTLMRGKPPPDWELVRDALPTLKALLDFADEEVQRDSAWALGSLSDSSNSAHPRIQGVIQTGAVPRLVELLSSGNSNVLLHCLRTIANLACGDLQAVVAGGFLLKLDHLLCHPTKSIFEVNVSLLSYVLAGPPAQIQQVLDAQLMQRIIERINSSETDLDIKKECAWCVTIATAHGTPAQIRFVASLGGVTALCGMLDTQDARIVQHALEGLRNFLQVGQQAVMDGAAAAAGDPPVSNPYVAEIEACGGLAQLKALQHHQTHEVRQLAAAILQTFFGPKVSV